MKTFKSFITEGKIKISKEGGPEHIVRIPISHISRNHDDDHFNNKSSYKNIDNIRKSIKKGKDIKPIHVDLHGRSSRSDFKTFGWHYKPTHQYALRDGHHRLKAHRLEGKKTIRAIISPRD